MGAAGRKSLPRVLITGFEAFPGAQSNPTEALVERLRAKPPRIAGISAFRVELLPVDYAAIGPSLSEIGRAFRPDIAIHFGLANGCSGFRLERVARNRFSQARPDNRGFAPADGPICVGPAALPSRLPLDAIHKALTNVNLPVEWSDDAGGYLCNAVFTLSAASACDGFTPRLSGFIHVPLVGKGASLKEAELDRGIRIILRSTLSYWTEAFDR